MKKSKSRHKVPRSIRRLFPSLEDVKDATRPVQVIVKTKDCISAKRMAPSECAMAKAAKHQYNADGAVIGLSFSYIIRKNKAIRFKTPDSVSREIVSFDRHTDFAPGVYTLSPVSPSSRLGHHKQKVTSGSRISKRRLHRTVRVRVSERGSS